MPLTFGTLGATESESQPSFIGASSGANGAGSAITVTLPTFQSGDLILLSLARTGVTTVPSLPSGYTSVYGAATTFFFTYTHSIRICYRIADASTPASFLASGATRYGAAVYRNASSIGSVSSKSLGTSATVSYPSLILSDAPGWVVGVFCSYYIGGSGAGYIPAGQTSRVSANASTIWDTANNVNSYAGQNASSTDSFCLAFSLELK